MCILTLNRQIIPCNWHVDKPWQHLPPYWNQFGLLLACAPDHTRFVYVWSGAQASLLLAQKVRTARTVENNHVTLFWAVPLRTVLRIRSTHAQMTLINLRHLFSMFMPRKSHKQCWIKVARGQGQMKNAGPYFTYVSCQWHVTIWFQLFFTSYE